MIFKQTSKEKEEKLVINVVGGSLPIVKYPKYLIITCLKRERNKKKKELGMFKKLKDQRGWSKLGGLKRGS